MVIETCPKCGAVLMNTVICTEPPISCKDCPSCGWHWEEHQSQLNIGRLEGMDWRCRKMARQIDLDQLMKYPLRRGSEHCDEKNADPRFLNGVESILEWAQTLPTLTPPNEPLTCEGCIYAPDLPYEIHCRGCARLYADHYRRPPEGGA